MKLHHYLQETPLLNFSNPSISNLIDNKNWKNLTPYKKIGAAYNFVRDDILFGYNQGDKISASQVLSEGQGQCNTKTILLMALLRALSIPCRLHGFTVHKSMQRGVVPELIYPITPENIVHSWVEVYFEDRWINLEGFILDKPFIARLQNQFGKTRTALCSFGAGTEALNSPDIEWCGKDTYIQQTAINNDFGVFDTPDEFFQNNSQNLSTLKRLFFEHFVRHWINFRVGQIRAGKNVKPVEETWRQRTAQ